MAKRILIITPFNPKYVGGAETFCKDLVKEARKEFDVEIVTMHRQYKTWDNPGIGTLLFAYCSLLLKAMRRRRTFKYETVHCLGLTATAVGVMLKMFFKVKVISTTLAIYGFEDWPIMSFKLHTAYEIFKRADVIFVEDEVGRYDVRCADICSPFATEDWRDRIKVFTHWVNLKEFSPLEKVYPPPLERDLDVLFVARPIEKKGIDIIKGVEWRLKREKINFRYIVDVPYTMLPSYYAEADIVVVPSLYDEGVSRVVIEASASGCLVIASNKGSLPDLVGPFGEVVAPTVDNFEDKIMFYHVRRQALKDKKKLAREYAEQHFSSKNAEVFFNDY